MTIPDTPFWQAPPQQSKRCTTLLGRLYDGTWQPTDAQIWGRADKAAKTARVHEWEWTNIILPVWAEETAAKPDCPWPIERLPHCPNQRLAPWDVRWKGRLLQGLCLCQDPEPLPNPFFDRVHWVTDAGDVGVPFYCHCGPSQDPPGSGIWGGINDMAYVCADCRPLLRSPRRQPGSGWPEELVSHRLRCDCRCCYCGGIAKEWSGFRLKDHPATASQDMEPTPAHKEPALPAIPSFRCI